ncbi:hypothetical protein KIN_02150 [Litoreibacter roseus]|uniref:Uncharacterized protein n=1 Tax=Litoreibacter roseus TaxID=2601869 RepID=A0A6N6JA90_9RHOB|nr:hypothetical protein KIN_02150 [Litoreibacter roseus]
MIDGTISADAPALFKAVVAQSDGNKVLINSNGGDVKAAMALGRIIRALGYQTIVGRVQAGRYEAQPGVCAYACVYAFLGGSARYLAEGQGQINFAWADPVQGQGGQVIANAVTATTYVLEMGADPGLLLRENEAPVLTGQEMVGYRVTYHPEVGFGPFVMEPYRDGIIVVSERLDEPSPYDRVSHLTAYCRSSGDVYFLLTSIGGFASEDGDGELLIWTKTPHEGRDADARIKSNHYSAWAGAENGFTELRFDRELLPDFADITALEVRFDTARVSGGPQSARIELRAMDQRMLSATLLSCI